MGSTVMGTQLRVRDEGGQAVGHQGKTLWSFCGLASCDALLDVAAAR